jgi:nitroimidazol reductase NimA-like FMN-containing flavoprotein (pyridoxamine 5'-phosphate oxidase superfamily)
MPSRRNSIALTEEEQQEMLNTGHTLQVASNGVKGFPHLVAMWYVLIDGDIVFTTFRKSQKVLNLKRNPKITVMLEDGKKYNELRGLVIEGNAEIVDDTPFTAKVMSHVGAKYNGMPIPTETPEAIMPQASKRVAIRVKVDNIVTWDHNKLGGRY